MDAEKKENALKIIKTILAEGRAAFFVGGCVRDIVLGNIPEDFDIATSAKPDEIKRIAEKNGWKTVLVGQAFGVVVIVAGNDRYEVSSFRTDTYGEDSHRPLFVTPVERIEDDLSRRDFTFNAMAMTVDGELIDPFGGVADLNGRIVRAVGNADERFAEDGLRMFRAVRFAAKFNFQIERGTFLAISKNLNRVRGLSAERVAAEIEKIIILNHAERGVKLLLESGLAAQSCCVREKGEEFPTDILPELQYLSGIEPKQLSLLATASKNIIIRWTLLLYLIALGMSVELKKGAPGHFQCRPDPENIQKASSVLQRLKIKSERLKTITWLLENYLKIPQGNLPACGEWLVKISKDFHGYEKMRKAVAYLMLLYKAGYKAGLADARQVRILAKTTNQILKSTPFFATQLVVSGGEIAGELGEGVQVGDFQMRVLADIQKGRLKNSRADLLKALENEKANRAAFKD